MTVQTWSNFTKRRNSTKRPSGAGTPHNVRLKEATSIEKPTFVFQGNDFSINYVRAFDHYYFVDDIKSVRQDIIEVSCSMDVGATFKSEIGSYNAYIERCASFRTASLPDPMISIKNTETIDEYIKTVAYFSYTGIYVISVLNDIGSGVGFTTYYVFEQSSMEALAAYINVDWGGGSGITSVLEWLQATFLHTADAIIDCIWMPIPSALLPAASFSSETVKVGVDIVSGVTAKRFTTVAIYNFEEYLAIPHKYTDFRKGAPYTLHKLFLPGYGYVDINALDFPNDVIYVEYTTDISTGDTTILLRDASESLHGHIIATYTFNIAVSIPIGHVSTNASGATGGIASAATATAFVKNLAHTSPVAAGIVGVASAINSIAQATAPTMSIHGGKGGRSLFYANRSFRITMIARDTTDPDDLTTAHGNLYMERRQISTCSGYVKCSNAEVPIAGMESDKQAVNDLLNSGFYYE